MRSVSYRHLKNADLSYFSSPPLFLLSLPIFNFINLPLGSIALLFGIKCLPFPPVTTSLVVEIVAFPIATGRFPREESESRNFFFGEVFVFVFGIGASKNVTEERIVCRRRGAVGVVW